MKMKIFVVVLLLLTTQLVGAETKFKRFDMDLLVGLWVPEDLHLKGTNSDTGISGYGLAPTPAIHLNYNMTPNFGLLLGLHPIMLDNAVDISGTNYENYGTIVSVLAGISGHFSMSASQSFYYGFGADIIPVYSFTKHVTGSEDQDASASAFGLFYRMGVRLSLTQSMRLVMGVEYTFVPVDMTYSTTSSGSYDLFVNLGGISLDTGLSFSF